MCVSARRSSWRRRECEEEPAEEEPPVDRLSPHGIRTTYQPSRRGFLIAMMGAGVMLGYARSGLAAVEFLASGANGQSSAGELFEPTIWYGIDRSGAVTVNVIRAELGQHVGTALARIVADELEADWSKVKIVQVDTDPKWGEMVTGGSWSVWQSFPVLSRAGAAGRIALIEEGAKLLSIDDSAAKGLPGYIQSLAMDDPSGTAPGWVMVYADSFVAADRAADLVKVTWNSGEAAGVSEQDLQRRAAELIADPKGGGLVVDDPGVDAAFASAKHKLERTYTTSTVMHFALEPINALAFEKDGIFEIHTGNQWQTLALPWLAKALGRGQDKIVIRSYLLGGGFGRRLDGDYAVPAALAAKAVGKPVKMVCTRPDDMRFDCPRSPSVQVLRIAFGEEGRVTAMDHQAAAGWPTAVMAPSFMPKDAHGVPFDLFAIHGADHWYTVGAQRLRALRNDLADRSFRPGYLRSVGSGWVNWALESFMDEAAHAAGVDPVAFRLRLLDGTGRNAGSSPNAVGGARRQAAVLARVAQKAGWGSATPNNVGLGVATTFGQERDMPTWVACVARVRVERTSGRVTVEKLTLVIDAGTIIHPDSAEAQVEGGALWGLSMAFHEGSEFVKGQPKDINLDTYTPLRMGDVPELEIEFLPSTEAPVGLGEPATTAVAPAIANAIFAASGARVRHPPLRPEAVRQALAHQT